MKVILFILIVLIVLLGLGFYLLSKKSKIPNVIYCFWTGDNPMSENRQNCLKKIKEITGFTVILVTKHNLPSYILPKAPLHKSFQYLSETHKSDYLRTYFMHFYGGGYSDIKIPKDSWISSFKEINNNSDIWICGYQEYESGVAYVPVSKEWKSLIGNCGYICRPRTLLTKEWYEEMIHLLDSKYEELKLHPSTFPQDCKESGTRYPIEWNEMLGRIFHKISFKYKEHISRSLPSYDFSNYR